MEKYTKWQDTSGINPFIPPTPHFPQSTKHRICSTARRILLASVRIPLFFLFCSLFFLAELLIRPITLFLLGLYAICLKCIGKAPPFGIEYFVLFSLTIGTLGMLGLQKTRYVRGSILYVLAKATLFTVSIRIKEEYIESYEKNVVLPRSLSLKWRNIAGAGNIILSNCTSFAEVIYLIGRSQPYFCSFSGNKAVSINSLKAFLRAISNYTPNDPPRPKKPKTIEDAVSDAKRHISPIVIFPEGVKTNGTGILKFVKGVEGLYSLYKCSKICVTGFSYTSGHNVYSPVHPVGPFLRHLFYLCSNTGFTVMTVRIIRAESLPKSFTESQTCQYMEDAIRNVICAMSGAKRVSLNSEDSKSFTQYWNLLRKGDKKGAAQFADERIKIS